MKRLPLLALFAVLVCSTPSLLNAGEMTSLFNGKSLEGWTVRPDKAETEGHWWAEDGMIVGENPNEKGSVLWTTKDFKDYEIELDYRTPSEYYDTGVMLRGDGHQVQIGISGSLKKDMTGCVYAPKDKKGSYPGQTDKVTEFNKPGEWNHLRVVLEGKRIQTFVNGEPFVDYEGIAINDEGPIGLQLHSGHNMKLFFKNIKVRELNK